MPKTTKEKIESVQAEITQLTNRKKVLIQKQNAEERKNRTHRLCKRGGYLESKIPILKDMTDEQFYSLVDTKLVPLLMKQTNN